MVNASDEATTLLIAELRKRLKRPTSVSKLKRITAHANPSDSLDALSIASASVIANRERLRLAEQLRRLESVLKDHLDKARENPLSVSAIITPVNRQAEGLLVKSTSLIWAAIIEHLGKDWSFAYRIPPHQWEEIIAGAFDQAGYDDVVLTPRSNDHGRDIIAVRHGVGSIKIIGSVKAYRPGNFVGYDDIRALIGVMTGEQNVSKGILATTSDFPPNVDKDPFIAPFMPYRLELMNGSGLRSWLTSLLKGQDDEFQ